MQAELTIRTTCDAYLLQTCATKLLLKATYNPNQVQTYLVLKVHAI